MTPTKTEQLRELLAEAGDIRYQSVELDEFLRNNAAVLLEVVEAVEQTLPDCDPIFGSTERLKEAFRKWNGGE